MKIHTAFLTAALAIALNGFALAGPKTYQVTGSVTAVTDSLITVQKPNKEVWEIARDSNSKVTGDLKVGSKVTIEYTMTAATVEVKAAGGDKGDKGKGGDKKKTDKK